MRLFEGTEFDVPPRCDRCGELEADCQCGPPPKEYRPAQELTVVVRLEKRKRGKMMTVVTGLTADDWNLSELVTALKNHCGAGGTLKGDEIEIQGDQIARVKDKLGGIGFNVGR